MINHVANHVTSYFSTHAKHFSPHIPLVIDKLTYFYNSKSSHPMVQLGCLKGKEFVSCFVFTLCSISCLVFTLYSIFVFLLYFLSIMEDLLSDIPLLVSLQALNPLLFLTQLQPIQYLNSLSRHTLSRPRTISQALRTISISLLSSKILIFTMVIYI